MARIKKQESPIIRLTHWQVSISMPNKRSKETPKDENWTLYGVDSESNEKVYAQIPSKRWEKWSKTDPLWTQAQQVIFHWLLSNPETRDTVIRINIKAALDKGDEETAKKLWDALSDPVKAELMPKPEA